MGDERRGAGLDAAVARRFPDAVVGRYVLQGDHNVLVAFDGGPFRPTGDLEADVPAALAAGIEAIVPVITAGGGRSGLGRVLVRWARVRLALREAGFDDAARSIKVEWLDPDGDPAIRRWATELGIGHDRPSRQRQRPIPHLPDWKGRPWRHIRRGEDRLLHVHWRTEGGRLWREVPVGAGGKVRRIDGVHIPGGECADGTGQVPWSEPGIRVIEAKAVLNSDVIGQAMGGLAAAREHGAPDPTPVALVQVEDPALVPVCKELGIDLVVVPKGAHLITLALNPEDPLIGWLESEAERTERDVSDVLIDLAREAGGVRPEGDG
jgi:hypothetical protein